MGTILTTLINEANSAIAATQKVTDTNKNVAPTSDSTAEIAKKKSCWAFHHEGSVKIAEICTYSINKQCQYEYTGCWRLHSKFPSQWQISHGSNWYNLRPFHSRALEIAFQNVNRDGLNLSPLDYAKLDNYGQEMFKILRNDQWEADFTQMMLINKDNTEKYSIRRVSTPSTALSTNPHATTFEWYFLDENRKWAKFGRTRLRAENPVLSEEIERKFTVDKLSSFSFSISQFSYILDFTQMHQKNTKTNKIRQVRRRPLRTNTIHRPLSQATAIQRMSVMTVIPSLWDSKKTDGMVSEITDTSNKEYQDVAKLFLSSLPSKTIESIKRIQNPFLWDSFTIKEQELSRKYGGLSKINSQRLFHGTKGEHVPAICKENFDFRLYGGNVGHVCGKGAYFTNKASFADKYCTPDSCGHNFMFLAEVLVGQITKGEKNMVRPPKNPNSGQFYDTTVDDETAPKIFVKYDKQEYYPLYVIEYR